jgi:hypothetical protein
VPNKERSFMNLILKQMTKKRVQNKERSFMNLLLQQRRRRNDPAYKKS